jgi:hypothetical protein
MGMLLKLIIVLLAIAVKAAVTQLRKSRWRDGGRLVGRDRPIAPDPTSSLPACRRNAAEGVVVEQTQPSPGTRVW